MLPQFWSKKVSSNYGNTGQIMAIFWKFVDFNFRISPSIWIINIYPPIRSSSKSYPPKKGPFFGGVISWIRDWYRCWDQNYFFTRMKPVGKRDLRRNQNLGTHFYGTDIVEISTVEVKNTEISYISGKKICALCVSSKFSF